MLEVRDLDVRYGEIRALRGISFTVNENEVVTLLGGNGAGKSTTLRTISGLNKPTSGAILFEGKSISGMSPEKVARMGIVHVPEGRQIIPGLTVHDNLLIGTSNGRLPKDEQGKELERIYGTFPALDKLKGRLGWSLSGGEQQMLAIGRGLMMRPRLLMLDEPSLGLAPLIVKDVFSVLQEVSDSGVTVLLVEQNAFQALKVADRGYVFETGKLVVEGVAADLLDDEQMRAAYLGSADGGGKPTSIAEAVEHVAEERRS